MTATVKVGAQSYDIVSEKVWVGKPKISGISSEKNRKEFYPGNSYSFSVISDGKDATSHYVWKANDIVVSHGSSSMEQITIPDQTTNRFFSITCEVNNTCGTTLCNFTGLYIIQGGTRPPGPVYPEKSLKLRVVEVYSFPSGQLAHKGSAENFDINTVNIPDGVYIVNTKDKDGRNAVSEKVMKKGY